MGNLISHPKQTTTINLDNVTSMFFQDDNKSKKIYFIFPATFNEENAQEELWEFESAEDAAKVHGQILDRFATEIS